MAGDEPAGTRRDANEEERKEPSPEATADHAPAEPETPPETETPDADAEIARLQKELEAARGEAEAARRQATENLDRAKRALADFENYKRRTRGDVEAAREKGRTELVHELLAVMDNFDRALEHAGDEESMYDGVKLIYKQFRGLLENQGLARIDSEGHAFDPTVHEAVMREPTTAYKEGVVIKELERGYYLNDRVLRPAKVKVAVAPEADEGADDATAASGSDAP